MLHMLIKNTGVFIGKLDIRIFLKQNSYFESWLNFFFYKLHSKNFPPKK